MSSSAIRSSSSRSSSAATISSAAIVVSAVDPLDLEQLIADDPIDTRRLAENGTELGDALLQIAVLILDFLTTERRQPLETQIEDGLCLELRELERLRRPARASSTSAEPRISAMTASRWSRAFR